MKTIEIKDCDEVSEIVLGRPSRGLRLVLGALVLLLALGAGWAQATRIDIVVRVSGRLRPAVAEGDKVTAGIGGTVLEVRLREGDRVAEGQVLARLDATKLDLEITRLERTLRADEEELAQLEKLIKNAGDQEAAALAIETLAIERATAQEKRLRGLVADGLEAAVRLEEAEGDRRTAAARADAVREDFRARREELRLRVTSKRGLVEAARESLKSLAFDRERAEVRSPAAGVVIRGGVRTGDVLEAGAVVAVIAPQAAMRLELVVPAADAGRLRAGLAVRAKFDAFDWREFGTVEGVLESLSPDSHVEDGRVVYTAVVRLNGDRGGRLRLGMTAEVEIVTGRERISTLLLRPGARRAIMDP